MKYVIRQIFGHLAAIAVFLACLGVGLVFQNGAVGAVIGIFIAAPVLDRLTSYGYDLRGLHPMRQPKFLEPGGKSVSR